MDEMHKKAMALADGELRPADLPALVLELARNSALLLWLQSLLRISRRDIAAVYARKLDEKAPQSLVDLIMTAPMGAPQSQASPDASNLVSQGRALLDRLRRKYPMPGWSIAAAPAFASVLAIFAAWLLLPVSSPSVPPSNPSMTLMTAQLEDALERTAAGSSSALPGFTPLDTYWSSDQNGWCRLFDIKASREQTLAIACRSSDGNWRVVLQTPPRPAGATSTAAPARLPLDGYIAASKIGPALEPGQVEQAIRSGWQPPTSK